MSIRDFVMAVNSDISELFDGFFYAIADGIDWIEPFLPWILVAGIIIGAIAVFT